MQIAEEKDYSKINFEFPFTMAIDTSNVSSEPRMNSGLLTYLGIKTPSKTGYDYSKLEFLMEEDVEEGKMPFGSRITHGTGYMYLFGGACGGIWGYKEGLNNPDAVTPKLRRNAILNGITKRAPLYANSLGVISIYYFLIESAISNLTGLNVKIASQTISAFAAGSLFKSFGKLDVDDCNVLAGWKTSLRSGGICGSLMFVFSLIQKYNDDRSIQALGYKMK